MPAAESSRGTEAQGIRGNLSPVVVTVANVAGYPTRRTGRDDHETEQTAPTHCPNGHPLGPRQAHLTYGARDAARETGHGPRLLGWRCRTCNAVIWEDGSREP